MGIENEHKYYSFDESPFSHDKNGNQLWAIGVVENRNNNVNNYINNNFRIVIRNNREAPTLKTFITKYIPSGNNLVTDGWKGYDWANRPNSGYTRYTHIHGRHDFGEGNESTSYVESLWSEVKSKINNTYNGSFYIFILFY